MVFKPCMITDPLKRLGFLALVLVALPLLAQEPAPKVLHVASSTPETTLDPVGIQDLYSARVASVLFEGLLTYDYLAKPAKIVPLLAEGMPEISEGGRVWVFHLKRGVRFSDDPAFQGKPRELKAADVVYSVKRLLDPALHSPFSFLLEGKLVGLDALARASRDQKKPMDLNAPIPGVEALDEYTVRFRLNGPDANFGHALAQPNLGIVAPELVAFYGKDFGAHPVGTGPYRVKSWARGSYMILERNPFYRERLWQFEAQGEETRPLINAMRGKRIPAIDQIEIKIIPEAQSAWLAFRRGEIDMIDLPAKLAPVALKSGHLKPDLAKEGILHSIAVEPEIIGNYLNFQDPVVGGMRPDRIALRRAILMSSDDEAMIRVIRKGQAKRLAYPIPPGVAGHDPTYRSLLPYDPLGANALLDAYGFRQGSDGFRRNPDGSALKITYWRQNEGESRDMEELVKRGLDAIHLQFEGRAVPFPDLLKAERSCQVSMRQFAWIADYPDGDDFMQLFYGPNIHANNVFCFQNAEWDQLYEKSVALGPGPERDRLYLKMARMIELYGIMKISHARLHHELLLPRVQGYQPSTISSLVEWPFLDLQ